MGRIVHLTEEQIRGFFGEGFGKRLIGESGKKGKKPLTPEEEAEKMNAAIGYSQTGTSRNQNYKFDSNYNVKSQDDDYDDDEKPASHTGFHQIERGGTSKDYPGHHGAWIKMHDLGAINADGKGESETDDYIKRLYELNGNKPVNIIDAIDILQQVRNGNTINGIQITNDDVKSLLDTLSIQTIFSNYLNLKADKYIYNRLMLLSKEELKTIKDLYGRDFTGWGTKCDACGVSKWKTTVSPFEHDDSHINLEYMGAGGTEKKSGEGFAIREEKEGEEGSKNKIKKGFTTYTLPFEIHHMNEVAGDNNPLNLACLCPNCHSLAGSTNKNKRGLNAIEFDFIKDNAVINPDDGSIGGNMNQEQKEKFAEDLKQQNLGYYNAQVSDEFVDRQAELCGIDPAELDRASNQIFNLIYNGCKSAFIDANANKLNENATEPDDKQGEGDEAVDLQNIGRPIPITVAGETKYITIGVAVKGKWVGAKINLANGDNRSDYRALASNMLTVNYIYYGNEQNNEEFRKSIKLDILNLFKKRYDNLDWADKSIKRRENGKDVLNTSAIQRNLSNFGVYRTSDGEIANFGAEELNQKLGDVPGREVRNVRSLTNPDSTYVDKLGGESDYQTAANKKLVSTGSHVSIGESVFPSSIEMSSLKSVLSDYWNPDHPTMYFSTKDRSKGWRDGEVTSLQKIFSDSGVNDVESALALLRNNGISVTSRNKVIN